jgi:hypothetical protein
VALLEGGDTHPSSILTGAEDRRQTRTAQSMRSQGEHAADGKDLTGELEMSLH